VKQKMRNVILLFFAILSMNKCTFAFFINSNTKLRINTAASITWTRHNSRVQYLRPSILLRASGQNNSTDPDFSLETYIEIGEPRILLLDLVVVAIACELLGLLDVLNDPIFWQKGGLSQSVPVVPSTLGILITRFSGLSVAWLLAGSSWRGFQQASIATDEALIWRTALMCATFITFRVGLEYLVSVFGADPVNFVDLARQCYFSVILLYTGRFIYSRYNR